ncbi:MAG TPA: site-2 protease family protein [Gemmatimonadales bacterium]|nr:site-2 protease family protein [Gemmatimonadales bacterium]
MYAPAICASCGTELAPTLLRCPACGALAHPAELSRLARDAQEHEASGRREEALGAWRMALALLPTDAPQADPIRRRVTTLVEAGAGTDAAAKPPDSLRRFGPWLFGLLLILWKFKFILVFALTKAKFLLLGLTKATTLLSMVAAAGVYWSLWGWKFALGIVGSIYIHEMGHVAALRHFGIRASAPMFIPGFGAVVRLHQHPATVGEDARVGLAGPLWGLGAALAALGIHLATGAPIWAAIARFGAWVNLFNLLPFWQLDGGRGFRALSRRQRWMAAAALGGIWFLTAEPLLFLLGLAAIANALSQAPEEGDDAMLGLYAALALLLALLSRLPVPTGAL